MDKSILIGILCTFVALSECRQINFYRKDYTYFEEFDAYYKIHSDSDNSWNHAFLTCNKEGAVLFYPQLENEWMVANNLSLNVVNTFSKNLLVGYHNQFGLGEAITVDGQATSSPILDGNPVLRVAQCILMDIETGKFEVSNCDRIDNSPRLFVCKKVDDGYCPTIDTGYTYSKGSKKCYKVNDREITWQEAMQTCFMEGGILAVIENDFEFQDVAKKLSNNQQYYIGFRKMAPSQEFYTVKGQKVNNMYNKESNEDDKNCGVMSTNYKNRVANCSKSLPFVCEMAVQFRQ